MKLVGEVCRVVPADSNTLGKAGLNLLNLGLDTLDHLSGIRTVPHQHNTTSRFLPVLFQCASPEVRSDADAGYVFNEDILRKWAASHNLTFSPPKERVEKKQDFETESLAV